MLLRKWVIILPLIATLLSCSGTFNDKSGRKHTITIAGSTSVMPFTEKLAEHFMVDHKGFIVDVQGGGSTAGIQATINNTVELGMSSRGLKNEEKRLSTITICYDGIAIVVHPDNPIGTLSLDEIRRIFSGRISNWRQMGWVDRRIDAVSREEGSGTRGAFEDLIMKGAEIDDGTMVQDSNGSVKEVVATDPYAIGYISMGLVGKNVKPVAIDGVSPSIKTIKSGRYKIVRPFLYVTNGEPDPRTTQFIDYVLSGEGQQILKNEGLVGFYD
ncbi:MAG: phosphate ABC transporter substrate-binding protein [Syntrophorhabdaceae bacterium]|nr:phosphate ABC transporter substrate-binding protein [Syntrophorhabdaceae bacterium]